MKALRCHEHGGPDKLVLDVDVPEPAVEKGQVRLAVKAAGVNFPDLLLVEGKYQFQPPLPFSPGGEVAGIVDAVGEGVTRFKAGDRVVALGLWGGFAEKMVLGDDRVLPLPEGIPFEEASAMTTTYGTCVHALEDRAKLRAGETVLVLGAAGGVGSAAIEVAKLMGARVIAAASSADKLAFCRELGADETIDYSKEDLKARLKSLGGADVIVDPVGGDFAEPALRGINWEGRYLVIGFAAGEIPKIPLNLTLLKGCSIVGVFWGSWLMRDPDTALAALTRIGKWVAEGKLTPRVTQRYALADGAQALIDLAKRDVKGKAVIVMG